MLYSGPPKKLHIAMLRFAEHDNFNSVSSNFDLRQYKLPLSLCYAGGNKNACMDGCLKLLFAFCFAAGIRR